MHGPAEKLAIILPKPAWLDVETERSACVGNGRKTKGRFYLSSDGAACDRDRNGLKTFWAVMVLYHIPVLDPSANISRFSTFPLEMKQSCLSALGQQDFIPVTYRTPSQRHPLNLTRLGPGSQHLRTYFPPLSHPSNLPSVSVQLRSEPMKPAQGQAGNLWQREGAGSPP